MVVAEEHLLELLELGRVERFGEDVRHVVVCLDVGQRDSASLNMLTNPMRTQCKMFRATMVRWVDRKGNRWLVINFHVCRVGEV